MEAPRQRQKQVLIVEDEEEFLEVLQEFLEAQGYRAVGVTKQSDAQKSLEETQFEVVISDIALTPPENGIQVLQAAKDKNTPTILISGAPSIERISEALNLGADRFLEKPFQMKELSKAIDQVTSADIDTTQKHRELARQYALSKREAEVYELVCRGLQNHEIARVISTSERTVKAHLSSLYRKTGAESRAELVSLLVYS